MEKRGGKREGAGRKKSPALAKITSEINQKHWRTNHHYIYLENYIFSIWRKVRAVGIFVNDSNYASWLLGLELGRRQASVHGTLFSTGRASVVATTWVWFLNLDNGEVVETKL